MIFVRRIASRIIAGKGVPPTLSTEAVDMDLRNVLVYTDGRPACERALAAGAAVARKGGGKLHVLHVAEPPLRVPKLDAAIAKAMEASQLEELDRLRSSAQAMGIEASCEARRGRPFVEIIRACQREGCHLVVKAARGRGRLGWPLLGSTALHLVRKCPVPVWLVCEEGEPVPGRVMALLASGGASEERQGLDRRVLEVACSLVEATGGEVPSDDELRALWLRNVQTEPADFLRVKFAYQRAVQATDDGGEGAR